MKRHALCFAGALLLSGCITSSREEALRKSIDDVESKVAVIEDRMKSVGSKTAVAETANAEVQELKRQLAMTQGAVDELRVKLSRINEVGGDLPGESSDQESNGESRMDVLERRVERLELLSESSSKETKKASKTADAPKPKYKTVKELTKVLGGHFSKKEYDKVQSLSNDVLSANMGAAFEEVALLFKAEAEFARENYKDAADDFASFLDRFPKSDRRPRALLLAGDSFVYLKQLDKAKQYYRECTEKFPKKPECEASKERLARLEG